MSYAKGSAPKDADYAKGGGQLGRTRDFIKESDGADQRVGGFKVYKNPNAEDEDYAKKGAHDKAACPPGEADTKKLKTVKPRK